MNSGGILCLLLFSPLFIYAIWREWYIHSNHSAVDDYSRLRLDAKIIDVQQRATGSKVGATIRTTVVFDDGFKYIAHENEEKMFFGGSRIYVTPEIRKRILEQAIEAHNQALKKKILRQSSEALSFRETLLYYELRLKASITQGGPLWIFLFIFLGVVVLFIVCIAIFSV